MKSLLSLNATSELSCHSVSQSAVAFSNNMPRIACLSATPQPLKPPANASSTLQLHSPIICRAFLSCPRPLNPPANASRNLQLHSPIICRALLSCPRPLNSPANASSALQLHSPIIRCASLSLTQPLNSPANASSALQLHSPIIYRALLSLTQPLNSPANASSALQLHSPTIYRALLSLTQPLNSPANASSALQLHFPIGLRTPKNQWKAMPQSRRVPPPHPRRNRAAHAPQPPRTKRSDPSYRQPTSLRVTHLHARASQLFVTRKFLFQTSFDK